MNPLSFHLRPPRAIAALLAVVLLALGAAGRALAADPTVAREVLVQLRSTAALPPLLAKYQLTMVSGFGARPIYRLRVVGPASVADTVTGLLTELEVLNAEPNVVHQTPEARKNHAWAIGSPDDYQAQWAPAALHLAEAHTLATGAGVRVAVLDTGVDRSHPALAGRLRRGFDFVDFDNDPSEEGSIADEGFGHGTHVAGLIALVAPGAKIVPLRVLDRAGMGNAWVIAEAMLYAVDPDGDPLTNDGAKVINLSLGSTSRTRLFDAIAKLTACRIPAVPTPTEDYTDPGYDGDKVRCNRFSGAVVVAAAGNGASRKQRQYPAAEGAYGLLAVAASNADSRLADFSNFGNWIDIAAPGEGLTSAVPGGGYAVWSGTSMAAPMAAGTAALLRQWRPGLTPVDIVRRLEDTSGMLCGTRLRIVDAAAALANRVPPAITCP